MDTIGIAALIAGGALLFLGVLFLFIGFIGTIPLRRIKENGIEIKGRIIDFTKYGASYNDEMYEKYCVPEENRPKVRMGDPVHMHGEFNTGNGYHFIYSYTVNGTEYTKADEITYGMLHPEKKIGQEVTVLCDTEKPLNSVMTSFGGIKVFKTFSFVSKILLPAGAVIALIGAAITFFFA